MKTGGRGVRRFDMVKLYAYISTGMKGYAGNILDNYNVKDPARPREVSRWCLPGQHVAAGETPEGPSEIWHLHHAMRYRDHLWAGCFNAGLRVIDISDITRPRTVGSYNYHPPIGDPTHTGLRVPRKIATNLVRFVVFGRLALYVRRAGARCRPHAARQAGRHRRFYQTDGQIQATGDEPGVSDARRSD